MISLCLILILPLIRIYRSEPPHQTKELTQCKQKVVFCIIGPEGGKETGDEIGREKVV